MDIQGREKRIKSVTSYSRLQDNGVCDTVAESPLRVRRSNEKCAKQIRDDVRDNVDNSQYCTRHCIRIGDFRACHLYHLDFKDHPSERLAIRSF